LIILLIIFAVIVLLLFSSLKIVYDIKLVNFKFSAKLKVKFPFEKELYDSSKPREKDKEKTQNEKKQRKVNLKIIKELKEPVTITLTELSKLLKRHCGIVKIEISAKAALEDPMENGIAYGIVSGVLNVVSLVLKEKWGIKKVDLEILSDFDSGEGLILASCGTLKVRPVMLLINVIFARKFIKGIKNIIDILKKEEKENG